MRLITPLLLKAFELGFEIRDGDLFRDSMVHGMKGVTGSNLWSAWVKIVGIEA